MNFTATKEEDEIIQKIVARGEELEKNHKTDGYDTTMDKIMDIEACHCNGNKLDLQKFLSAKDGDFGHDYFGIRKNINRTNGKLENYFSPRCSA